MKQILAYDEGFVDEAGAASVALGIARIFLSAEEEEFGENSWGVRSMSLVQAWTEEENGTLGEPFLQVAAALAAMTGAVLVAKYGVDEAAAQLEPFITELAPQSPHRAVLSMLQAVIRLHGEGRGDDLMAAMRKCEDIADSRPLEAEEEDDVITRRVDVMLRLADRAATTIKEAASGDREKIAALLDAWGSSPMFKRSGPGVESPDDASDLTD